MGKIFFGSLGTSASSAVPLLIALIAALSVPVRAQSTPEGGGPVWDDIKTHLQEGEQAAADDEELSNAVDQVAGTVAQEPDAAARSYPVRGWLALRYRYRTTGGVSDQDLFGTVSLDGGRAESDDITFHLLARGYRDFAGSPPGIFVSLDDVGGRWDGHIYEAWVDLRRSLAPSALGLERIRLGRQNVYGGFTYAFDGATLVFDEIAGLGDLRFKAFGGVPVYFFQDSRSGNWLAGLEATLHPADRTFIELRYVHVADRPSWAPVGTGTLDDDFTSLTVRQGIGECATLTGVWNTLDGQTRDLRGALDWSPGDHELHVRLAYHYQRTIATFYTTPYDPFVVALGPSFAFHQFDLQVSKILNETFALEGGFSGRFLDNSANEGPFNHEFWRVWITLSAREWPCEDVDVAVTGDYWDGQGNQTGSGGVEITWRANDRVIVTGGSFYSLFKYDLFVIQERTDATTLYAEVKWKFVEDFRLDVRYEFETGDLGRFHTVVAGLTWTF